MKEKSIDFVGIGAQKAGSSWVAEKLRLHPEICLSEPKELNFFNEKHPYARPDIDKYQSEGISTYLSYFQHCPSQNIRGEFSPNYLWDPRAPERIYQHFPTVKIIVCLRNPVDRAYSQYSMLRYMQGREKRPFMDTFKEEPEYRERGLYFEQLSRYLAFFPIESFIFIEMEEIKETPREALKNLYQFLGVADSFMPAGINQKTNASSALRSEWLNSLAMHFPGWMARWRLIPILNLLRKMGVNNWFFKLNEKQQKLPVLSLVDRKACYEYFEEDVKQLTQLLGRDFPHWKA